jgi:ubiquinone/menaquinone biosynthesis C-methylase UbiE
MKEWYYNEFSQTGINFESDEEVRQYDEKYKSTRNLDAEAENIAKETGLRPDSIILEIGTGTGELAIGLSGRCGKVYACDVSEKMLAFASKKAEQMNINNIEFLHSGFLNLKFGKATFDAVITQLSLHHLPDFWKSAAIHNISELVKPGGKFYLLDSMFSFETGEYENSISGIINFAKEKFGDKIANEIIVNIRDEYPTYGWIIEGMLQRSGFKIETIINYTNIMSVFISTKK